MQEQTKAVPFKENFIFITLFMFLFFGFMVSFFPEENVRMWLIFNCSFALLAAFVNYIIWLFQKHDSKRYFSLHSFVMLWALIYYAMSPIFKVLYPSRYFWILLIVTIAFTIFIYINRINISRAILNPGEIKIKKLLVISILTVSGISFLLSRYINLIDSDAGEIVGVSIIFYLIANILLILSPVLLTKPEVAKKLKGLSIDEIKD